ncbi:MAG: M1 family metallopeptidase [Lutibacter sp.]
MKSLYSAILFILVINLSFAQKEAKLFTHEDTLRGTITPERSWWNVLRYDISIKPNFSQKTIKGLNKITYKVVQENHTPFMQIDLQKPMQIDSVFLNEKYKLDFIRDGNVYHISTKNKNLKIENTLKIYFHGKPKEAVHPPWKGGWSFIKDNLGRPWITVTCQGLGASVWFPNKDHQSDEPDNGATLTLIVPNDLVGVANGRLKSKIANNNGTTSYTWEVVNPINNYNIIPYIGNYVNFKESYSGLKGKLDLNYWVLDYNLEKAKNYLPKEVHNMLKSFEYWFGAYPFYEDGYKLVETNHLGMEHQSAIAYGNHFKNGYLGSDLSGTGLGLKWDYIVVHESGHEWFGNNITSKDIADMYIHESFTDYSETLFVESMFGKEAGNQYNVGLRRNIRNDRPIIGPYGVNKEGSGDMYYKGAAMLQTIRHSINKDSIFRNILIGLNQKFYHKTVTNTQIQNYISDKAGFNYSKVFYQYLNTTQVPELLLYSDKKNNKMFFKWSNCVDGFNLPLVLVNKTKQKKIYPTQKWQSISITKTERDFFKSTELINNYYVTVKIMKSLE